MVGIGSKVTAGEAPLFGMPAGATPLFRVLKVLSPLFEVLSMSKISLAVLSEDGPNHVFVRSKNSVILFSREPATSFAQFGGTVPFCKCGTVLKLSSDTT